MSDSSNSGSREDEVNSIPIASPIDVRRRHRNELPEALPEPVPYITMQDLYELFTDYDDYYSNPLVSHTVFENNDFAIDDLDRIIASLTSSLLPPQQAHLAFAGATASAIGTSTLPSLLRPDVSSQQGAGTFPSDPYTVPGKIVKNARLYVESVDIPQNSNWSGGIDYLEEGRLIAFSITCNDPDITPTVFIENSSGTQDVINDLSFKQAVQHGRGMTLSEATSTFIQNGILTSRDVSGQPSPVFPYVKRYKDQLGGSGVYADVRDTENDKSYVMNFEPTTSIPYQRISFQVFNGSALGTRMINRLELKRLIYVDPDPVVTSTVIPSDLSQLSTALNMLSGNISASVTHQPMPPPLPPQQHTVTSHYAGATGGNVFDNLYEDFIKYLHKRINERNVSRLDFGEKVHVSELEEQKKISDLMQMATAGEDVSGTAKTSLISKPNIYPDTMYINWE